MANSRIGAVLLHKINPARGVMRLALIGATGMVGQVMRQVLEERQFLVSQLLPVASASNHGQWINWRGDQVQIMSIEEALKAKPDLALFSAGSDLSVTWAKAFTDQGCVVIDNSSAWRMDPDIPLVVPQVNASALSKKDCLIANPNCSTIQLVMVLKALDQLSPIGRVLVSTYQAISGTGKLAVNQLTQEIAGDSVIDNAYPYQIHQNVLPHCDDFLPNGYTKEEMKLTNESVKILGNTKIQVSATAVRVPIQVGHSESVNIAFLGDRPPLAAIRQALSDFPGITLQDDPQNDVYPMPLSAEGKDDVFVGRLRKDLSCENAVNLWIVSDNLRKGAASNAIDIAAYLLEHKLLTPAH